MHLRNPIIRPYLLTLALFQQSLVASPFELRVTMLHRPLQALDPARAETEGEQWILKAFNRGLVQWENNLTPGLDLAIRLESQNNQRWVFHLHPEACWSNGEPLEAQNFIQSWSRLYEKGTPAGLQNQIIQLGLKGTQEWQAGKLLKPLGLQAPNPHTLILELEKPMERQALLACLCHPAFFPIHPQTLNRLQSNSEPSKREMISNGLFIPLLQDTRLQGKPNPKLSPPDAISEKDQRVQKLEFEQNLGPLAPKWSFWGKPSGQWKILELPVETAENWNELPLKGDWGKRYEFLTPQMLFLTVEPQGAEVPASALLKLKQAIAIALTHPSVTYDKALYRKAAYAPFFPSQNYHPLLPRHLFWSLERRQVAAQRLLEASEGEWHLWIDDGEREQLQKALELLLNSPKLHWLSQPPEDKSKGYQVKIRIHQTSSPDPSFEGQLSNWKACLQLTPELRQAIEDLEAQRELYTGVEQEDDRLTLFRCLEALFLEEQPCIPWLQRSRLFEFQLPPEFSLAPLERCTSDGYPSWRALMNAQPSFELEKRAPQSWLSRWF